MDMNTKTVYIDDDDNEPEDNIVEEYLKEQEIVLEQFWLFQEKLGKLYLKSRQ